MCKPGTVTLAPKILSIITLIGTNVGPIKDKEICKCDNNAGSKRLPLGEKELSQHLELPFIPFGGAFLTAFV